MPTEPTAAAEEAWEAKTVWAAKIIDRGAFGHWSVRDGKEVDEWVHPDRHDSAIARARQILRAGFLAASPPQSEAGAALVAVLDEAIPHMDAESEFAHEFGFRYSGPSFGEPLEALRLALSGASQP